MEQRHHSVSMKLDHRWQLEALVLYDITQLI